MNEKATAQVRMVFEPTLKEKAQQGVKDSGDYMQVYNPNTGNVDYVSKANMRGWPASRSF